MRGGRICRAAGFLESLRTDSLALLASFAVMTFGRGRLCRALGFCAHSGLKSLLVALVVKRHDQIQSLGARDEIMALFRSRGCCNCADEPCELGGRGDYAKAEMAES